jgi:hypothetical protein
MCSSECNINEEVTLFVEKEIDYEANFIKEYCKILSSDYKLSMQATFIFLKKNEYLMYASFISPVGASSKV